jgi:CPA2 family monovalent cation:H+ antiporter-2
MMIVGRRVIPWALHYVAHTGSRELFRLAVLAIALGVAFGAAMLFGVSFALGAFFAGMILAESPLSQRAANETLPLRDAFAVLFFVSVGMLFNPHVVTDEPLPLLGTVAIIIVGKSIAALAIVMAFRHSAATALTIAASLAQIGEFSFILATMGHELKLIPAVARDLILAGAIISILLNPLIFAIVGRYGRKWMPEKVADEAAPPPPRGHVVLIGYGRVGSLVGRKLLEAGEQVTIIEAQPDATGLPEHPNATVLIGNACEASPLDQARLEKARLLCIAIAEGFEVGQIVERARKANPAIRIIARAQDEAEVEHFSKMGADVAITGEREIARSMVDYAFKPR